VYRVRGSGFLKHMVRNIVGTLLEAGKHNLSAQDIRLLLSGNVSQKAGPTVPASGLFLVRVEY
jgi:tRNA pseudouridine38-40 synthase